MKIIKYLFTNAVRKQEVSLQKRLRLNLPKHYIQCPVSIYNA